MLPVPVAMDSEARAQVLELLSAAGGGQPGRQIGRQRLTRAGSTRCSRWVTVRTEELLNVADNFNLLLSC